MGQTQDTKSVSRPVSWRIHGMAMMAICVLGAIAYSNTLHTPFYFDDTPNIVENHRTRVNQLNPVELFEASFDNISPRPIAHFSFALNYYFGEYDVFGYHLVNIGIHLINGILVYGLAFNTYELYVRNVKHSNISPNESTIGLLALFAAGIFVVHPMQTQAVTYLVQRMASLATLFYLLSLWLYIRGRLSCLNKAKWTWWTASIFAGLLAIGTKQIAATLPLAILLYEFYFFQDLSGAWVKQRLKLFLGVTLVFGLVALVYLGKDPFHQIFYRYDQRSFTMGERVLTQFRVVVFYISLVLLPLPSRLNFFHFISTSHSLFDPISTLFSMLTLVGLIGLAVYWARTERILSFSIIWFLLQLVIESSVLALEMIFEHRVYLPMFSYALVVPYLVYRLFAGRVVLARSVAVVLLLCFSLGTYVRNSDWQDESTLYSDIISKNPKAMRAYVARGTALGKAGDHANALADFERAIELDPDYSDTYMNRGKYFLKQGKPRRAQADLTTAIELAPKFQRAYMSRGDISASLGELDSAVEDYTHSIELAPDFAAAYNNRGIVYGRQGKKELALQDFAQAIALDIYNGQAYFNRGSFYRNLGELDKAIEDFSKAIELEPEVAGVYVGRGSTYESLGNDAEAVADYQQAIALGEDTIPANKRLAWLLASSANASVRNGEQAIENAKRACGLANWQAANCLEALAAAYAEQGEFGRAIEWQNKAIQIAGERISPVMLQRLELYRQGNPYRLEVKAAL